MWIFQLRLWVMILGLIVGGFEVGWGMWVGAGVVVIVSLLVGFKNDW